MNNTLSINIRIDNRVYPLLVSREEEENYRNAAKKLNELVLAFRKDYPGRDAQDFIAMAAFQFVYETLRNVQKADDALLLFDLKDLRDDLTEFLEEKSVKQL